MQTPKTEKAVVNAIKRWIERQGGYAIKTTGVRVCGTPDLLACIDGHLLALEVKRPGAPGPTIAQQQQLHLWRQAGATAGVVRSVEDAENLVCGPS